MGKLHDVARRLGVETYIASNDGPCDDVTCAECYCQRPRLDIAHECLGKLPMRELHARMVTLDGRYFEVETFRRGPGGECWMHEAGGTFEEAVIALAERFLKEGICASMGL